MIIPKINSAHGSETRNIINTLIDYINGKSTEILSSEGVQSAINEWLDNNDFKPKEAVATFQDLPTEAELKELRGVTGENAVYVYDGAEWIKQSQLNFDGLGDVRNSAKEININANDYLSIQTAIDEAPSNATVTVPFKDEIINVDTLTVDKPLTLDFSNNKLIPLLNKNLIDILGKKEEGNYALSVKALRNDNKITLTTTPENLNVGDVIVIRDDSKRVNDNAVDMNLETHEIERIDGNVIYLKGIIGYDKEITTENVYKITPIENVTIRNIQTESLDGATQGTLINADMVKNLQVDGIKSVKSTSPVVRTMRALGVQLLNFDFGLPQKVTSGYGYGLQAYAGTMNIIVRNGKGFKMRHTLDFHSAYDIFIENITTNHETSSSVVLSHNGWGGRFSLVNVDVLNGAQYGISLSGQGIPISEWENRSFDSLTVKNCKVHLINNDLAQVGIRSHLPINNLDIKNVEIFFGDKTVISNSNSSGLSIPPINSYGTVSNFSTDSFHWGINENFPIDAAHKNQEKVIRYRDIKVNNASVAFNSAKGANRSIDIRNLKVSDIAGSILRLTDGSVRYINISDILITKSEGAILFNDNASSGATNGELGSIVSLDTSLSYLVEVTSDSTLNNNDIYLMSRQGVVNVYASDFVTMASPALQDGIVLGQKITILNTGNYEITIPKGTKIRIKDGQSKVITKDESVTFVWINGAWREV